MTARPATRIAAVLLALVSAAQLLRVIFRVEVIAGGLRIPLWPSLVAFLVAGALALKLWRESRG